MYRLKPGIKTLLRRKKYTRIQLCEETNMNVTPLGLLENKFDRLEVRIDERD